MTDALPGRAELAARRVLAVGAAIVALINGAVALLLNVRAGDHTLPPWFGAVALVAAAAFLVTGMAAPWLPARGLRVGAALSTAGYLVLLVAFLPAAVADHELERIPWILSAAGAAIVSGLLAGGMRAAWATLGAALIGLLLARTAAGGLDEHGIVNDAQMAFTGVIICVICGHLLAVTRELDEAADAATTASAQASAERGRLAARTRAAAVVHDEVLATLTLARAGLPVPVDRLAAQARRAAGMLTTLAAEGSAGLPLAAALEAAARRAGARFVHAGAGKPALDEPVRDALEAATRQALENSVRHAGDGAVRRVVLTTDAHEVAIEVIDDGVGFDPAAVAADRLGVRTSIRARLQDVGGAAEVTARPGEGTRVRLVWRAPEDPDLVLSSHSRELSFGLVVIAVVFVVGQTASAAAAALASQQWWPPLSVLVALLVGAEVLRRSPTPVPSRRRTAVFVAVAVATVAGGLLVVPFTFGTLWFVSASAFLLLALALRGRVVTAVAGVAVLVTVVTLAGAVAGAPAATVLQVIARPLILVALAVALMGVVERLQRHIRALHRRTLAATERRAWDEAARAELSRRADDLDADVVPLLRRIGEGTALSDADRGRCASLEGRLRDEYRAGILVREPLAEAARAARARGVDVVLLDDTATPLADDEADALVRWMAAEVMTARHRVVGRVLPEGREAAATVTVDGTTTRFRGSAALPASGGRLA